MRKFSCLMILFLLSSLLSMAQHAKFSLDYYLEKAFQSSPLQLDELNQVNILDSENQYLKNVYTHAQTLLTGNYLFVPIIQKDNGKTSFKWNAQSANDYYGYDLGVSNGNLQCGVTWTKPLLGNNIYKAVEAQTNVQKDILKNNIRLSQHDIERNVIDQYILCMLDKNQRDFADSISTLLSTQADFITRLATVGQAKQSDIQIIKIEQHANDETKAAFAQSYHNHLMELNALCCIRDSANVKLEKINIDLKSKFGTSQFLTKYNLDSINTIAAQRVYETRYKPQLNLFTNMGVQTTQYSSMYKNVGFSVGLSFSVLLSDGKLKRIKQQENKAALASISIYKNNLNTQNEIRLKQCSSTIKDFDLQLRLLNTQINDYKRLLEMCQKEVRAGQLSVFDYITTLKNIISTQQQKMTVEANRQLAINAFNYYNW
jgi:outer membrane protein TolC